MKSYFATATLVIIALLTPIIPFLLLGEQLESWTNECFNQDWLTESPFFTGLLVIGLLGSDILLPIPSSMVCTAAGKFFGTFSGSLICWLGLNISTAIGYWTGSLFGWPAARRFCSPESLSAAEKNIQKWGIWPIILLRGFPVLAEASMLIAGIYRFPIKLLFAPVLCANLGVAIGFVALGEISSRYGWFSLAVPISLGIPVAWLVMWLLIWKPKHEVSHTLRSQLPEKEKK